MPTTPSFDSEQALKTCYQILDTLSARQRTRLQPTLTFIEQRLARQQPADRKLGKLLDELQALLQARETRRQQLPEIRYPETLPVVGRREDIAKAIQDNQVVIIAGETGSGKTTQIPKICLELGFGIEGRIGHTQPRRIAARTVASRIAEELGVELGGVVGYQVRFTDHSDQRTAIKLMTDGILLAEIQADPLLHGYDVLIIDEAHERSLNIDFLLGYLKQLLPKRPDLKVIVTSATIDVARFADHFNEAPVIEVSGRTFPVEVRYRPWSDIGENLAEAVVATTEEILQESRQQGGDILVFLSGEREIREVSLALKRAQLPALEVLPLYARLSLAEQNKVFQSHRGQRIVLATNVAETSITVPGIRYVIDSGLARISRYSVRTKVQRLPIEPISQASANQRKGRCGRVSEGICYRLYDEEDFLQRPEFSDPELLRTNLAAVVLQMLQMKMGRVEDFPFIDPPDQRLINDGYRLLEELHAVNRRGQITALGKKIHGLSVDPRFARMLIESERLGCVNEVLIIVSALTIQDPRERPQEKQQAADEKHRRFFHEHSDFLTYVNLWRYVEAQRQELSQNQWRKQCKKEFLNFLRLREWRDLHHQLKTQTKSLGFKLNDEPASYEQVHQALLVGLLSNIGRKNDEDQARDYLGTRGRKFMIFPGSGLKKKRLPWVMAAEFIETTQLYAHYVAKIDVNWVLHAAEHLIQKEYFEPHYEQRSGSVKAFVKKRLWGLVLSEKQRVEYAKIDPALCRELFIRSALVEGQYRGNGRFFKDNAALIEEVTHLEAKARRRDILVDDQQLFAFYDARIPEAITNLAGFEHWRKTEEKSQPELLRMTREDVMLHGADNVSEQQFPEHVRNGALTLPVRYEFDPTRQNDGMNVLVPVGVLHQIQAQELEWLVPGLLTEKCIALVKTLPKQLRKTMVPVPHFVERALARMTPGTGLLLEALAEQLSVLSGTQIPMDAWQPEKLDAFYHANIVVLDERGKHLDQGRDLESLREKYKARVQETLEDVGSDIEKEGIQRWDFGELPEFVELARGQVKVRAYPALQANTRTRAVDLKMTDNPIEAAVQTNVGICQLALNELGETARYARKQLLRNKDVGLTLVDMGSREEVVDDLLLAAVRQVCFGGAALIDVREPEAFKERIRQGRAEIVAQAEAHAAVLLQCLAKVVAIRKQIKSSRNALAMALCFGDIQTQLNNLFYRGCLFETPWEWVQEWPRYMDAILVRMEKAPQKPQADRVGMHSVQALWQQHEDRVQKLGKAAYLADAPWQQYRWMLEEFRVSLFAQTLKTRVPVSEKRLKKLWSELG